MKNKLIILGCGSSVGVPRIDGYWGRCKKNKKNIRSRCSAIIIKGSNNVLIDTSPDIKSQLLKNKITNISSVVYTHQHADQVNGLFELRPFFWKNRKKIELYGNIKTLKHLRISQGYLFKKIGDYPPIVKSNIIKNNFNLGKAKERISFDVLNVKHGKVKSLAYIFEKIAYISDCKDLSIIKSKKLINLNYLIIDCLRLEKHTSHFTLKEALYVHNCLKPKKTILTNLNHELDYNFLLRKLPKNVLPAYDGLTINF